MRRMIPTLLAALVGLVVAAPASQATTPVRYVALGDSYSAASGVLPPDPSAPPNCMRSTANYPHVIAAATGAALTDVTCGARRPATTSRRSTPTWPRSSTRCTPTPSSSR